MPCDHRAEVEHATLTELLDLGRSEGRHCDLCELRQVQDTRRVAVQHVADPQPSRIVPHHLE